MAVGRKAKRKDYAIPLLRVKQWRKLLVLLITIHVLFISWLNRLHHSKKKTAANSDKDQTYQHHHDVSRPSGGVVQHNDKQQQSSMMMVPPPCRVLVHNQHAEYHYEVLESIVAMYPIEKDPKINCDHSILHFSVAISTSTKAFLASTREFQQVRSNSWQTYAEENMMPRNYTFIPNNMNGTLHDDDSSSLKPQIRMVKDILRVPPPKIDQSTIEFPVELPMQQKISFHYQIIASCYCGELYKNWVFKKSNQFCLFHGICPRNEALPRSFWVHPSMKSRSIFPIWLPQFDETSEQRIIDKTTHHVCVIGSTKKREYELLSAYLHYRTTNQQQQKAGSSDDASSFLIHHFGRGDIPECMQSYGRMMQFHDIQEYLPYQRKLYQVCDAILPLITTKNHPEYFTNNAVTTRMTGSLVQAASYHKPALLHEDLVPSYGKLLDDNYLTHDDTAASFIRGMTQLLHQLSESKNVR